MDGEAANDTRKQRDAALPVNIGAEREVRFAVVMYGGVSLAIYINGVCQELLSMVRATAPKKVGLGEPLLTENELKGAAKVYRVLGERLGRPDKSSPGEGSVTTRFIVDVISGTSAGGINGLFLGKALARNQDMEGLK